MATNRTRRSQPRKQAIADLSGGHKLAMFYSCRGTQDFFFSDIETMRLAWEIHREEIRAEWRDAHPKGTRCYAEWLFEICPKYGERKTTPYFEKLCEETPSLREQLMSDGILHTDTIPEFQEPQSEFLRRHGLLESPRER